MSCDEFELKTKIATFDIFEHETSGWFFAKSDDVPNFYTHGKTIDAIKNNIRAGLKDFYQSKGYEVEKIHIERDKSTPKGFLPSRLYAKTRIEDKLVA